ncbi:MAG: DUF359 domain-containing protein [Conexivisphaerales archaeon]
MQRDNTKYILPPEVRERLKQPFGRLVPDEQVLAFLQEMKKNQPAMLITVGDMTTRRCEEVGLDPLLEIIDNREKREVVAYRYSPRRTTVVDNPAATITGEAMREIEAALKAHSRSRLVISGEEDLLVLPCILYAQEGAIILYGQPNQGLVAVTVDERAKSAAKDIISAMKRQE